MSGTGSEMELTADNTSRDRGFSRGNTERLVADFSSPYVPEFHWNLYSSSYVNLHEPNRVRGRQKSTCAVCIFGVLMASVVAWFATFVNEVTVQEPSRSKYAVDLSAAADKTRFPFQRFLNLQNKDKLNCPCTNPAISYMKFTKPPSVEKLQDEICSGIKGMMKLCANPLSNDACKFVGISADGSTSTSMTGFLDGILKMCDTAAGVTSRLMLAFRQQTLVMPVMIKERTFMDLMESQLVDTRATIANTIGGPLEILSGKEILERPQYNFGLTKGKIERVEEVLGLQPISNRTGYTRRLSVAPAIFTYNNYDENDLCDCRLHDCHVRIKLHIGNALIQSASSIFGTKTIFADLGATSFEKGIGYNSSSRTYSFWSRCSLVSTIEGLHLTAIASPAFVISFIITNDNSRKAIYNLVREAKTSPRHRAYLNIAFNLMKEWKSSLPNADGSKTLKDVMIGGFTKPIITTKDQPVSFASAYNECNPTYCMYSELRTKDLGEICIILVALAGSLWKIVGKAVDYCFKCCYGDPNRALSKRLLRLLLDEDVIDHVTTDEQHLKMWQLLSADDATATNNEGQKTSMEHDAGV